jgi:hypothetical protein
LYSYKVQLSIVYHLVASKFTKKVILESWNHYIKITLSYVIIHVMYISESIINTTIFMNIIRWIVWMITSTTYKNFATLQNYRINQTNFVNIVIIYGNTNISNTIKARIKFSYKRAICSKTTILLPEPLLPLIPESPLLLTEPLLPPESLLFPRHLHYPKFH